MDTLLGLLFSLLWASATIAAKFIGRESAPLTILSLRFLVAMVLLLFYSYVLRRGHPLPKGREWGHLAVLGFTNSTCFLGASWVALRVVPAGLYQLLIATGPFMVALLSAVWLGRSVLRREWWGMGLSAVGLVFVMVPTIQAQTAVPYGIVLVVFATIMNSLGSVYAKWAKLTLPSVVVNSWQITWGLLLLIPFALWLNDGQPIHLTVSVIVALLWSIFAVSIGAMIIWFYLVRRDPLHASNWLFITPVAGYLLAVILLGEPIHWFDAAGTLLVMVGLALSGTVDVRSVFKRETAVS